MQPAFTKVLYYHARFTCVTPMRIGDLSQEEDQLLRRKDGSVYLPASSIAGALRNWKVNEALWGGERKKSALTVSDAVIESDQVIFRHRINLRGKKGSHYLDTGVGINSTNREIAILPKGTCGCFTLIWQGTAPFDAIQGVIEEYLSALDSSQIRLGAERSNDFGRVTLCVSRGCYDMTVENQRESWLSGQWQGTPISLPALEQKDVVLRVCAQMPRILVGTKQHLLHYTEDGEPVIPASSLKGVLRRWCHQICPLFGKPELETILFGSSKSAGNLIVSDGHYSETQQTIASRRGIIDKVSGAFLQKQTSDSLSHTGQVQFQLCIPAVHQQAIGLLLYLLRDFGFGMFELGAASSIGWGYAESVTVHLCSPAGTGILACSEGTVRIEDPDGVIAQYSERLEAQKYDSRAT